MNRRTLFLLIGAAAVGLIWGGDQLYRRWYEQPKQRLEAQLDKLTTNTTKARRAEINGKATSKNLGYLVDYSLPYNPELARSAYQDWLLSLVKSHGMENASVDAGQPRRIEVPGRVRKKQRLVAHRFPFSVRAKTNLNQLTAFFYDFYRAGHLHKITSLTLNPVSGGSEVDLNLSIEALSLEACDREAELSQLTWSRLQDDDVASYQGLSRRNIFARGLSKALSQIELSGVTVNRSGVPEAWFAVGPNQPTQIVTKGQFLAVELFQIEVVEIQTERVSLSVNGDLIWLELGQRLGDQLGAGKSNVAQRD